MTAYQMPAEQLRVGHPTPFGLVDAAGHLLMARGMVIESAEHREQLLARGAYIDSQDTEAYQRALTNKIGSMLLQDETLGRIAQAQPDVSAPAGLGGAERKQIDPLQAVRGLQMHVGKLLRETPQADFPARLLKQADALFALAETDPDTALLILIDATTYEQRDYSTTHAMLVAVVCDQAARHLPGWTAEQRASLRCAALTMNIAMTVLQDILAQQVTPPNPQQREQIDRHAERGAQLLATGGVDDALWIEAVRHHHGAPPGPLAALPAAQQMARLIKRADIFAARLSPRRKRSALSGAAAAKAAYLDDNKKPDEAGAAVVKATGIYPPGSYVRLASGEVAVVMRRGVRANEPLVAGVIGRSGTPIAEPALRNTRLAQHAVTAGVAPDDVKLRLNLERLLRLL
jgi:HD-GYP domain-containing protein (c-di-GMP phosphodiesterase class II)